MTNPHTELVHAILLEYGSRPDMRLWKVNNGAARTNTGRVLKFGIPDHPDIGGIQTGGRYVAIECKTGNAVLSKGQRSFRAMFEAMGGLYVLARSVDDVETELNP